MKQSLSFNSLKIQNLLIREKTQQILTQPQTPQEDQTHRQCQGQDREIIAAL